MLSNPSADTEPSWGVGPECLDWFDGNNKAHFLRLLCGSARVAVGSSPAAASLLGRGSLRTAGVRLGARLLLFCCCSSRYRSLVSGALFSRSGQKRIPRCRRVASSRPRQRLTRKPVSGTDCCQENRRIQDSPGMGDGGTPT